ncbi:outer membrane protein TolC [Paraburkholderia sp. BL6665CI2N2]|uniref:TolC family protein n=1 Tax=Paraburkholderia sp. BL6665CI2N2 TaxID=1938806 RepID=UPI0010E8ECBA|nr:TolC family protein [Paraburkholderia sp. BL6665CI2N2]TDY26781.1 outer membrane protein TolC [Paraburkholderia sp. BL6665CI2N2]
MPVLNAASAAISAAVSVFAAAGPVAGHTPRPYERLRALVPLCALLMGGCTWYHREPLAPQDTSTSAHSLERIRIDPASMPLPELAAHHFDPSDGLDIDEVAMLAVANNPDLRLARDDLGIARAQAYSAGLLPDPQLSIASDYPGQIGTVRAFNYGLSMDVMAIVLRSANKQSADATVAKTDLGLLWQEWQIVAQARQLFIKTRFQQDTLPLLQRQRELTRTRYERMAEARRDGNLTDDTLTAALLAYGDARKQYTDTERAAEQTHHDLNALLGISPEVQLQLTGGDNIEPLSDTTLDAALAGLPRRRPDLIALQAGYEAQEQKYRAAILSQFPSLSVGFVRARDTSNIYTSGFQINLSLPIFNRNQGNVAIEQASRQRLRDEYQTRLNSAYGDVAHLRADNAVLTRQLQQTEAALPEVDLAARHAAAAYGDHSLALGAYTDAQSAALTKQIDVATLRESLAEQRVGLQALLGSAIPDAYSTALTFTDTHAK